MAKKQKTFEIVLEINEEDACKIWAYDEFIKKHVKAGNVIPNRVFLNYLSFLKTKDARIQQEVESRLKEVKEETKARFLSDKNYFFEETVKKKTFGKIKNKKGVIDFNKAVSIDDTINLGLLIEHTFNKLPKEDYYNSKQETVNKLVYAMFSYFDGLKIDSFKLISDYKRQAIIGFITYKLGIALSKELRQIEIGNNLPTNEQFKAGAKYYYDKAKKAQK